MRQGAGGRTDITGPPPGFAFAGDRPGAVVIEPIARTPTITVRAAGDDDRAFLYAVFASTRRDELVPLGWDDRATESFLTAQFDAEDRDWHRHHQGGESLVVLDDEEPVGRLCMVRTEHEIRVLDLTLLPQHRGHGIGTALLMTLVEQARRTRRTVRLQVDRNSRTISLCRRLGFAHAATRGGSWLMEWS